MTKRKFLESNGYPCAPEDINENLWFYVDPKGLHIITRKVGGLGHIPWSKIKRALKDREMAKSRKYISALRQGQRA